MKKNIEVEYIAEQFGITPIYDVLEGKSWVFKDNRWIFVRGSRVCLSKRNANSIEEVSRFIEKSTAYLPSSDGYIIAFLYGKYNPYSNEMKSYRQIGLLFIEDKIVRYPYGFEEPKLPLKVKRQPPIIYTREQFYKIKTENIFGKDIANFESNGILVEFDYRGTLSPEQFLYLERPTIHTNGDKFHISYECEDLPFYNSISKKT